MTALRKKIANRIRAARQAKDWTVEETAKRLSAIAGEPIAPSRYSNWEQGIRAPKLEQFIDLGNLFGKPAPYMAALSENDGTAPETALYTVPKPAAISTPRGPVDLAQVDDAFAYSLAFLESQGLNRNALLPIRSGDDSMRGIIGENDRLLIDRSVTTVTRDDLFALLIGDRIWLRWIRQEIDGTYSVKSEAPEQYPDQRLTREELDALQILGRVKIISNLR